MFSSTDIDLVVDLVKALEHKQPEGEVADVLEVGSHCGTVLLLTFLVLYVKIWQFQILLNSGGVEDIVSAETDRR